MKILFTLFPLILLLLVGQQTAVAQSDPAIARNELDSAAYPRSVTFTLKLADDTAVTDATLIYEISKYNCIAAQTAVPADINGRNLTWTWEMVRSGNPPPGAAVTWQWQYSTADGQTHTTSPQTHTFSDGRYTWQTVSSDNLNLHWYRGDIGPQLLEAAEGALTRLEEEMGIELQDEVNLYIYGDTADMRDAVLYIQDWAGGVAFTDYNVILMGIPPHLADSWGLDVVPHELAHLVVAQYGRSCVGGSRPSWLEEGLATVAEGEPTASIRRDIEDGIANNSFAPLRSLNGAFPAHDSAASMAYSQSYSVVQYLLDSYGAEAMQQLIHTLAAGAGYDAALEEVYGFNVDGLEQEWRAAIGAPPRTIPPTVTPVQAAAIPTIPPAAAPQSVPTSPAAAATAAPPPDNSGSNSGSGLCFAIIPPLGLIGLALIWQKPRRKETHA
jgi:hypothetical protein